MREISFYFFLLCSIILIGNNSFAQGPGVFSFANNLECELKVTIWAFEDECESIDCDNSVGSIGPITVAGHSVVNVAFGYSGNGDVWGKVLVKYNTPTTTTGTGDCIPTGPIYCLNQEYVQWDSCNGAHIP